MPRVAFKGKKFFRGNSLQALDIMLKVLEKNAVIYSDSSHSVQCSHDVCVVIVCDAYDVRWSAYLADISKLPSF